MFKEYMQDVWREPMWGKDVVNTVSWHTEAIPPRYSQGVKSGECVKIKAFHQRSEEKTIGILELGIARADGR